MKKMKKMKKMTTKTKTKIENKYENGHNKLRPIFPRILVQYC